MARATYDRTVEILGEALNKATVDGSEKVKAFRRLLFPYNSVVGVIDDPSDLEAAVQQLRRSLKRGTPS